jgi:sugar-specific transcriptional regulator TrmB
MSERTDSLLPLLQPLGIKKEEASLYLLLRVNASCTALEISRKLDVPRTRVYRMLDSLVKLGLVNSLLDSRGQRFEAAGKAQLEAIVAHKEFEAKALKTNIDALEEQLSLLPRSAQTNSKVHYYHGVEGLKQVTWNSLKAKGELLTLEISDMNAFFDKAYAEDMRLRFVENKIKIRTLTNNDKISPWTDVAHEMVEKYWAIRHIPEKHMKINFEILIYNDVYTLYRYQDADIFCVEIYNKELAEMQRQVFEFMWKNAKPFKVLNNRGEAVLL